MNLLTIMLQAAAEPSPASNWSGILMMVLIFVVFYFFMIRPQSKRQKEVRKFQDSLEAGKHVVTSGGIYGKIKEVKDNIVVLEIADNVRIKVNKTMVFDSPEDASQQPAK
jgi:preprotein translocase subunit YajC